jgi:hypothetical protein
MIKVGDHEPREVSQLNHELFTKAEDILGCSQHQSHIGWSGVGNFIDWLEENYTLERKEGG